MISIKSLKEQNQMRHGGRILAKILQELKEKTKPGMEKVELDLLARQLCRDYKVRPSFLGYEGYPAAVCVSLNNEVVHGIPDSGKIKEGDLVSLDMGVIYDGLNTDAAISFVCGEAKDEKAERIIKVCEQSFYTGCDLIKEGVRLGDVSAKIQEVAETAGYGVVRMLVGHGIGENLHEAPPIPNYGDAGTGPILKEGMTLAIEPMITESGNWEVKLAPDGWTYETQDGSRAAHFEHTILVTKRGFEVLTEV